MRLVPFVLLGLVATAPAASGVRFTLDLGDPADEGEPRYGGFTFESREDPRDPPKVEIRTPTGHPPGVPPQIRFTIHGSSSMGGAYGIGLGGERGSAVTTGTLRGEADTGKARAVPDVVITIRESGPDRGARVEVPPSTIELSTPGLGPRAASTSGGAAVTFEIDGDARATADRSTSVDFTNLGASTAGTGVSFEIEALRSSPPVVVVVTGRHEDAPPAPRFEIGGTAGGPGRIAVTVTRGESVPSPGFTFTIDTPAPAPYVPDGLQRDLEQPQVVFTPGPTTTVLAGSFTFTIERE